MLIFLHYTYVVVFRYFILVVTLVLQSDLRFILNDRVDSLIFDDRPRDPVKSSTFF